MEAQELSLILSFSNKSNTFFENEDNFIGYKNHHWNFW